jgi:Tfp pilus assembly protein PilF
MADPPLHLPLELALDRYEAAIAIVREAAADATAEQVHEILLVRRQVQASWEAKFRWSLTRSLRSLVQWKPWWRERSRRQWQRSLNNLDQQVRELIGSDGWQILLVPIADRPEWLQRFSPIDWRDRFDWMWQALSLSFLTISVSLLTPLAARFWEGGPDRGVVAIIFPSVVALMTGSGALTTRGRHVMEKIMISLNLPKKWWDEAICLLAGLLLLSLMATWSCLPQISMYYVQQGDTANAVHQRTTAIKRYDRATKLDPNNGEAHYKLANLYRDSPPRLTEATALYELAVQNPALKPEQAVDAYNTLMQFSLRKREFDQAETWLRSCQAQLAPPFQQQCAVEELAGGYLKAEKYTEASALLLSDRQLVGSFQQYGAARQYRLLTQLGQAFLAQKLPAAAEDSLRQAIALKMNQAPAHCLLAQTLEQRNEQKLANSEWELCIAYTRLDNPDEAIWFNRARQRLAAQGVK